MTFWYLTISNGSTKIALPMRRFITPEDPMKELVATVTRKGQVTVPAEVRRHLGVGTPAKVAFVIDGDEVRLKPVAFTLDTVFGSVPARPGTSPDFEREIEEAKEEAAARRTAKR